MKNATKRVIKALTAAGCRITKPRLAVITALAAAHQPVAIAQLVEKVSADEASVYRTISLLEAMELIEVIEVAQQKRYAISHEHHDHIVCDSCGRVEHIDCIPPTHKPKSHSFSIISRHTQTFYGLCVRCS